MLNNIDSSPVKFVTKENALSLAAEKLLCNRGGSPFIVGIDGRCASGKSAFASELSALTGAAVVHADDFFLRPEQRTAKRYASAGENLDWERLLSEVLLPLGRGEEARFRPFNCRTLDFDEPVAVSPHSGVIVEGTYCLNRHLSQLYSFKIFMDTDKKTQELRIKARNGEYAGAFFEKWLPLEELYFSSFDIPSSCDICVRT